MTKLTMVLARGPGLPEGDLNDRLSAHVRLTSQGLLDAEAYAAGGQPWVACRERPGQAAKQLELVSIDERWALQALVGDDDPLWTFEGHVFRPGELVLLRRPDGEELIFRVVALEAG